MDPCLTQKIPIDLPNWRKYSGVPKIKGYSQITTLTPILETFLGTNPNSEGQLNCNTLFFKTSEFHGSGSCIIDTVDKKKRKAFCKVTHLLDPTFTLKSYYTHPQKGEIRKVSKLNNPMNQAYVDSLANYLLGQLREKNLSPHFCLFYGGFKGVADIYRYNITEEFGSYRKYKSFWDKRRQGLFDLYVDNGYEEDSIASDDSEVQYIKTTPKSSFRSSVFSYTTSESEKSHISLKEEHMKLDVVELESVKSFASKSESEDKSEDESDESEDEGCREISVYAQLKNYPVMLIFQEEMEGVLDDLLEDDEAVGSPRGSKEWEEKWTAWTFQVIAALCAAQGVLGFTHNDLHTNNIVWTSTEESWLWYKNRDGTIWRIPTFGKIFRIIDFGRSIFRVNDTWFISDDYEKGGDANGQYNFGHFKRTGEEIYPNPSFDLCRYSVSLFEVLFPNTPPKMSDTILSKEGDWIIYETESPLWNLLWSWLIDENGYNILYEQDRTERFPNFDLYQHISAHIFCAKPQDQIKRDIFNKYQVTSVGDWETVYPLFC